VLVSLAWVFQMYGDAAQGRQMAELAEQQAGGNWDAFDRLGLFYKSEPTTADLQHAHDNFEQAVKLAPQSPLAHRHLGQILLKQGRAELALKEFKRSLAARRMPVTLSAIGSF